MKYTSLFIFLLLTACIDDPTPTPITETKWIDVQTHNDTIIANPGSRPNIVYYAIKNWQSFPDSNFSNGFRQIIGIAADSVLLTLVNSTTTNYYGPYQLGVNAAKDTLKAQNFLDTVHSTLPSRLFILLQ